MKTRMDLLDEDSPEGMEVVQITTEDGVPGSHIYMEAQIFTPDSRLLLLHRSAGPHGGKKDDPEHRYLVCDVEDGCRLSPLTDEVGPTAPSLTPDGKHVYYFVDETEPDGGRLSLKCVGMDGSDRRTVMVVDAPVPGTTFRPSRIYPLSTISSDGKRLALSCFLGDGRTERAPWGLMVFDLERATVAVIIHGTSWINMHPQYCRSANAEESHDILIQENHGNVCDALGKVKRGVGGRGADIHVVRDDGSNFRNMPWGRDGNEFCQGHQCWRGRSTWGITSTGVQEPAEQQLIEGRAAPHAGHVGIRTPRGLRNDLSRTRPDPHFMHFATDADGRRFVTDAGPVAGGGRVFLADLGQPGKDPLSNWIYLLSPRSSLTKGAHIHPFLSPDGTKAFFNSDESGLLQAYMIRWIESR